MSVKKWLILLFFSLALPANAAQKIVSVATLGDYAPFLFNVDNQLIRTTLKPGQDSPKFHGYSWDVFRESFHIMNYTIHLKVEPWARAMKEFETGKVDLIFPAGKNRERLKKFNYSQQVVNNAQFLIYVRADNPLQWHDLSSLTGLKIGVIRGYNYGNKWTDIHGVNKIKVKNILTGFEMLEKGRIDGFVGYEFHWDYHLKEQGWVDRYRKLPRFDSSNEYVLALKTNNNGQQLLDDFDLGKKKLIQNGRLQALKLKWALIQ